MLAGHIQNNSERICTGKETRGKLFGKNGLKKGLPASYSKLFPAFSSSSIYHVPAFSGSHARPETVFPFPFDFSRCFYMLLHRNPIVAYRVGLSIKS